VALVHLLAYLYLAYLARLTGPLAIDHSVREFFRTSQHTTLGWMLKKWAVFGDWQMLSVGLICLSLFFSPEVRRRFLLFFLLALGGGGLVGQLTKMVVGRMRPRDARLGFPSGHTIAAMITVCGLLYFGARSGVLRRPVAWGLSAGTGALIVLGVGVSRMYTDSHWLTDVFGGIMLGVAVSTGVAAAFEERVAARQPMADQRCQGGSVCGGE